MLASGSRDKSILLRDVRLPDHFTDKLAGHRSEVCGLKVGARQGLATSGRVGWCHTACLQACSLRPMGAACERQARVHACTRAWRSMRPGCGLVECVRVAVVQWSPDDKMLASGGNDNALILWQVRGLPNSVACRGTQYVPAFSWSVPRSSRCLLYRLHHEHQLTDDLHAHC
jgi:WD40 repeat protein